MQIYFYSGSSENKQIYSISAGATQTDMTKAAILAMDIISPRPSFEA